MTMHTGAVTVLEPEECWRLLETSSLGRVAASAVGTIDIFPVNYCVEGRAIYFRTAPGTKLLELAINDRVAFEVDDHTDAEAWSVVVKGRAERLELQSQIDHAETLPLTPWLPTLKYRWVRIVPDEVSGRRFDRTPEPPRF